MNTKIINGYTHVRYFPRQVSEQEMITRANALFHFMNERRTVRDISSKPVPKEVIEHLIMTASSAPSGAHKQPWTFCAVSNPVVKSQIREAAEKEEYESYHGRMSKRWLNDLAPIGTDWNKPFLENAPWLIIVFKKAYDLKNKEKTNNYYVNESVGIACGLLITAIHHVGLVTLTHTPSPMNFLTQILDRPENERPFLLLPVGYPEDEVYVPDLKRKSLKKTAVFYT